MAKEIKTTIFRFESVFARSSPKCLSFGHVESVQILGTDETSQYSKTREILHFVKNEIALLLRRNSNARANRQGQKRSPHPAWSVCLVALAVAIIGLIVFKLGLHVTSENPAIVSLLYGCAPLIGLLILQIIVTCFYSLLICSVEQILADDDTPLPKHSAINKLSLRSYPFSTIAFSLSLKEHSPPDFPILVY